MATERTVGSYWDKQNFSDEDYSEYEGLVNAAKSGEITWKDANTRANQIRSKYGYNGGSNGHEYNVIETGGTKSGATDTAPTWLSNATSIMSTAKEALNNANISLGTATDYANTAADYASQYANYDPFTYSRSTDYDTVMNSILNPEKFSYDYTTDPQYQAYKKEYTREGQRATADTLGQVAAMTGGQVSSNAVNAATQAGDYYSAQLADKVPELYQAAYNMYQDNINNQYNQLSALNTDRNYEYGVYSDDRNALLNSANEYTNLSSNAQNIASGYNSTASNASNIATDNYNIYADIDDTNYNRAQDALDREEAAEEEADEKALAAAQLKASAGDYSGYQEIYGLSDAQVQALNEAYQKGDTLESAKLIAQLTGDYTELGKYYGWTDAQIAAANAAVNNTGSSRTGSNPKEDEEEETQEDRKAIIKQDLYDGYSKGQVMSLVTQMHENGDITDEEFNELREYANSTYNSVKE